jgi:hypothetical protein
VPRYAGAPRPREPKPHYAGATPCNGRGRAAPRRGRVGAGKSASRSGRDRVQWGRAPRAGGCRGRHGRAAQGRGGAELRRAGHHGRAPARQAAHRAEPRRGEGALSRGQGRGYVARRGADPGTRRFGGRGTACAGQSLGRAPWARQAELQAAPQGAEAGPRHGRPRRNGGGGGEPRRTERRRAQGGAGAGAHAWRGRGGRTRRGRAEATPGRDGVAGVEARHGRGSAPGHGRDEQGLGKKTGG